MADELRPDDVKAVVPLTSSPDANTQVYKPDDVKGVVPLTSTAGARYKPDDAKGVVVLTAEVGTEIPAVLKPDNLKAVVIVQFRSGPNWPEPSAQGEKLRRRIAVQGNYFRRRPGQKS